jgi:hypothetical protein
MYEDAPTVRSQRPTSLESKPSYGSSIHIDQGPFQYISMDLITDLLISEGYNSVLTIVDQGCSKAAKFLQCQKTIDGPRVARLYLMHLVPMFRLPK